MKLTMRRWMGCRLVPVRHLLHNDDAPWLGLGFHAEGRVRMERAVHSGWPGIPARAESQPCKRPSYGGNEAPLGAPSNRSVPGAQQPEGSTPTTEPCPTGEGPTSNPDRRTGPRTEDLNTPPVRSALPAESNLKSAAAAFPRGPPGGERINPQGQSPGNRDRAPKISMAGNLGKARQRSYYQPLEHRTVLIAPAGVITEIVESS